MDRLSETNLTNTFASTASFTVYGTIAIFRTIFGKNLFIYFLVVVVEILKINHLLQNRLNKFGFEMK